MQHLLNHPLRLIGVAIALTALITGYRWLFQPDPQAVFLKEVKQMIATVNQGSYGNIEEKLSPAFREMLLDETGMNTRQAILMARKMDVQRGVQYRFANNPLFEAKRYAEVEIDRSGPDGNFEQARRFPVPYIWIDGEWMIAGGFQSRRSWEDPF